MTLVESNQTAHSPTDWLVSAKQGQPVFSGDVEPETPQQSEHACPGVSMWCNALRCDAMFLMMQVKANHVVIV